MAAHRKGARAVRVKIARTPRLASYPVRLVQKVKPDGRRLSRRRRKQQPPGEG